MVVFLFIIILLIDIFIAITMHNAFRSKRFSELALMFPYSHCNKRA